FRIRCTQNQNAAGFKPITDLAYDPPRIANMFNNMPKIDDVEKLSRKIGSLDRTLAYCENVTALSGETNTAFGELNSECFPASFLECFHEHTTACSDIKKTRMACVASQTDQTIRVFVDLCRNLNCRRMFVAVPCVIRRHAFRISYRIYE